MRNNIIKLTMLAAFAFSCTAVAYEWRSPLVDVRGPLRYDIYEKKNKISVDLWNTVNYRETNKTFLKNGFDTHNLPAVIFGQESFTISQSFQNGVLPAGLFVNQNPLIATQVFTPQATYSELGATMGGKVEFPIWGRKGRLGLRGIVPFKRVRMQRDDENTDLSSGLSSAVIEGDQVRELDGANTAKVYGPGDFNRYKLSLLSALSAINAADGKIVADFAPAAGTATKTANTKIVAGSYSKGVANTYEGQDIPFVIIKAQNATTPPFGQPSATIATNNTGTGNFSDTATDSIAFAQLTATGFRVGGAGVPAGSTTVQLLPLPNTGLTSLDPTKGYVFINTTDYTNLAAQPGFNQLWATPVFEGVSTARQATSDAAANIIDAQVAALQFGAEDTLGLNNFEIATYEDTGIGDLDLDLYYEHTFTPDFRGELWVGVRFPTGGTNKYYTNPYRVQEGNGGHFEIELGGKLGGNVVDWLTLKADASYSFVLQSVEQRSASYQGATVKNIGPRADADVDWGYFTGHLDSVWYYPKSDTLATTFGYEFFYKTKDNVRFKNATAPTFLGQVFGTGTTPANATTPGTQFINFTQPLSNSVAEMGTESMAHRLRGETNWRATAFMNLFVGGAWSFAGQNIAALNDVYGGMNVKF